MQTPKLRELASGLRFPEGPVWLPDGSIVLVEIASGEITRVDPKGRKSTVARPGGGPNGAALGPDGKLYVANNGGSFTWHEVGGLLVPGPTPPSHTGGRIERIDLESGKVDVLYTECDGRKLRGPNDLVLDAHGGIWFTDHGTTRERERDRTGVFYAKLDGSAIREAIFPLDSPNGIGLSPDGRRVYVAETHTGRVWQWDVPSPGSVTATPGFGPAGGTLLWGLPGFQLLDSLAVDSAGHVCVATLVNGGITAIAPDGSGTEFFATPDPLTTNVCFGGPDLRTAFVTLSGTGKLVSFEWPRPGLRLVGY
ncbi:MAG TPA: SMP-30/gluconolactonase/LRE family protein [Myxococcota bacterium]|jgi:gluconolactonase|nr:SMP-30/gluconolactonase/LRE family protein [Myxococcota bacterium]